MRQEDETIIHTVRGDIASDVATEVKRELKKEGVCTDIAISSKETAIGFAPDPELVVALAGALAAVFSFLLELYKFRESRSSKPEEPKTALCTWMGRFRVFGFEVLDIREAEGFVKHRAEYCVITIQDIPQAKQYEITIWTSGVIEVNEFIGIVHTQGIHAGGTQHGTLRK